MSLTTQWSRIEQMQGEEAAAAWQWFVDHYRDFVAATLRRIVWDKGRAAAAADEFWGYLFQHEIVGRLRRGMRFRSFLISTLRNYALDWLRRNPRPAAGDPADDERADAEAWLPEDEEMALWTRQLVHLALQRLTREQARHAHVLRAWYGVPATPEAAPPPPRAASDIADEHGLSDNALHQLLFRARARLRECVVEEVRQTVSTRGDLDGELALLTVALGRTMPGLM